MCVNKKIMLYGSIFFFQKLNISKDVQKKFCKKKKIKLFSIRPQPLDMERKYSIANLEM